MEKGGGSEIIQGMDSCEQHAGVENQGYKVEALEILPELAWLKIFEKLPVTDLYACYQTCEAFQDMLEGRRVSFLLPHALHPLLKRRNEKLKLDPGHDLLNCRLVNRSWKLGVDEYCQAPLINDDISVCLTTGVRVHLFSSSAIVDDFKTVMQGRPKPEKNPFFSRRVEFSTYLNSTDDNNLENRREDEKKFWKSVTSLLEIYGKQIWYCNMYIEEELPFVMVYRDVLLKLMNLMPNLKSLLFGSNMENRQKSGAARRRARALVRSQPLPRLLNLLELRIDSEDELIQSQLLGLTGDDPSKLEMLYYSFRQRELCPVELLGLTKMTNLKSLSLSEFSTENIFTELKNVGWPLTVVNLELRLDEDNVMFLTALEWLNKFGGTLRKVTLSLWGKCGVGKKESRLRLPHLEQLTLKPMFSFNIESIDFLLELKQLKFFTIFTTGCMPTDMSRMRNPREIIKFAGLWSTMEESNIWAFLLKLKKISFCTEDEYNYFYYR